MKLKISTLALLITLFATTIAAQEVKFGHINVADVILLMPEYKNIETVITQETDKLEKQLNTLQKEVEKIEIDYENNYENYTPQQRAAKEEEYGAMQQRIQEFYQNAQASLQQKQQELQLPVLEKLQKAIERVGEDNNFLYIFEIESGVAVYHSEKSTDITPLVKKELNL